MKKTRFVIFALLITTLLTIFSNVYAANTYTMMKNGDIFTKGNTLDPVSKVDYIINFDGSDVSASYVSNNANVVKSGHNLFYKYSNSDKNGDLTIESPATITYTNAAQNALGQKFNVIFEIKRITAYDYKKSEGQNKALNFFSMNTHQPTIEAFTYKANALNGDDLGRYS